MNLVSSKWVYSIKYNSDGSIERYKAHLVAQGFHQQPSIDYHETFSPVFQAITIRIVLSLAISNCWPIRQLEVKNAFLYGILKEEVFRKQPPGFIHPDFPHHAPRAWFHHFSTFLFSHGFTCSKSDTSMFVRHSASGILVLLLYVDDIILTGSHSPLLDQFISLLSSQFSMKDLGELHYFLGVQVVCSSDSLHLSQQKYISDFLLKFHMHTCKPVGTPLASRTTICLVDGELLPEPSEYMSMVGVLQYLTLIRPDIAYVVNVVSQFIHAHRTTHLHCVKRIFRYLHGTTHYELFLRASSSISLVVVYSDVDWATCPDTRRSTTGFDVFLGSNLISWRVKKQPIVSRSSTEAQYKAIAYTVAKTSWIHHVLCEFGLNLREPIRVLCDNVSSTYMSRNPVFHDRSKHIDIDNHYVRDKVAQGDPVV
ncbi:uncharacterized mitochondrial protein AtMg00810-like [Solanum tuberosum]|uniref:uncharacterized mitochondrial protein AtMg00810-like n=1 Tax=Solanum tuberosum TaxID=4113 RepID=UPI00073A4CCB|nr:PREDICTED: uncharacterized mitochondrial protein AtMg00810-like [Solanum tuberosum]